jgi:uncharacterized protein (DUF2147 family)
VREVQCGKIRSRLIFAPSGRIVSTGRSIEEGWHAMMRVLTGLGIVLAIATASHAQSSAVAPQPARPPAGVGAAPAAVASPLAGYWRTDGGKSQVLVTDCGGNVCANIVWLKEPNDKAGRPLRDANNENPKLRARPILGLPLFEGMRPAQNGWSGRIYNPEDGGTFNVTLSLAAANQLKIKGCVLFVCETHTWTRDAEAAAPAASGPASEPARPQTAPQR